MEKHQLLKNASALALTLVGHGAWAQALTATPAGSILGYDARKTQFVRSPKNQWYTPQNADKPLVYIWNEQAGVVLPSRLAFDIGPYGGVFRALDELGTFWIPAGTKVDSAYLHYAPGNHRMVETTVTFRAQILGVQIISDWPKADRLFETDRFILPEVPWENYWKRHFDLRGLDFPPTRSAPRREYAGTAVENEEWIEVKGNRLTLRIGGAVPGDQIRVITASIVPDGPPPPRRLTRAFSTIPQLGSGSGARRAPASGPGASPTQTQGAPAAQPGVPHLQPSRGPSRSPGRPSGVGRPHG